MEKKGDLLNQLAIIADLMEKANIEGKTNTLLIELDQKNFVETFIYVNKRHGGAMKTPTDKFTIKIGVLDIVFSKSNV